MGSLQLTPQGAQARGRRPTVAVCISCGAIKFGALVPCPECQAMSETEDDLARAGTNENIVQFSASSCTG